MTLQIVRFTTLPEHAHDVEAAVAELFDEVDQARPTGIRYLATRHPEQARFELLLHLGDGVDNPLPAMPRAARFRQQVAECALGPAIPETASVLGRYRIPDPAWPEPIRRS